MEHFVDAAGISEARNYGVEKRCNGLVFAQIEITSCERPDWWYAPYIGETCMAILRFANYGYGKFITEAVIVYLTKTKIKKGRTVSSKDFIIL